MEEFLVLNNRYQLIKKQGKGGMAIVYVAKDLMLERTVAIKILRQAYSENESFRRRFLQEAKAAANLSHPNIVTVHDFGWDHGYFFIVMEHVPGIDAKAWLNQHKPISINDSLSFIIQACAGLGYAHRAGLVHCDIKPQNMLITPDKRLKITDFGIARALASIPPDEKSSIVWGSPQYISPEMASGLGPTPASDVYSLGVVLYEFITGKLPFTSNTAAELVRLHREVIPNYPSQFNPNIPPELEQVIMKVLAKEPSARYRTADQLGRVLINIKNGNISAKSRSNDTPLKRSTKQAANFTQKISTHAAKEKSFQNIDWGTILLSLVTLLAVGGLIPFWIWVYFHIATFLP